MKYATHFVALGVLVGSFTTALPGQLAVDATGPVRERARVASMGRGSGVGRKMALRVAIAVLGGWDDKGKIEVDFILTNTGKDAVTIPISPNPGDFEPVDPKASYTVKCLALRVASSKRPGGILSGGADLYGSPGLPGTSVTLAPGDSVRMLTRVALLRPLSAEPDAGMFVASATLADETIKTVHGQTISETQEIGTASSPGYPLTSLFNPH